MAEKKWNLFIFMVSICLVHSQYSNISSEEEERHYELPPYDGWYNNPHNPSYGAADTQLFRFVPPAYKDGVYEPSGHLRPNPIEISQKVFNGSTGLPSFMNRTAFLVFFGQQVVEEILDAQRAGCPVEYFNIPIPKGHPQYDPEGHGDRELPVPRTRHDMNTGFSPNVPRQQLNEITPYLDGGLVYGINKAWADALRSYKDGLLAATNDSDENEMYFPALNDIRLPMANPPPPRDNKLKPIARFFKLGNPRGNENPFLLTFGIFWFRYHNFRARQLKANHPDWNDEKLFNEARKWVIAVHQKITVYDWLPAWTMRELEPYTSYDPSINPNIAHVFQSAAMRFGHTLVVPGVYRRNAQCEFRNTSKFTGVEGHKGLRTCNSYWNGQDAVREQDIDEIIMGMASQHCEREDMIITPDLRGDVFGPLEFSRRDLMAINIQRGRDHGLPDYNTAREAYGLPRVERWEDVNENVTMEDPELVERFRELYGDSLDDADIFPAGMLETKASGPGPLFRAIIMDQFRRIRDGDRFWYENRVNKLFSEAEIDEINNITMYDIILQITKIKAGDIQRDPFFFVDGDPCMDGNHPGTLRAEDMENCTEIKYFDYFEGSEVSYALSIAGLLSTFFMAIGLLICLAKRHERQVQMERAKNKKPAAKNKVETERGVQYNATEYMGKKQGERAVSVKMDSTKQNIVIYQENSDKALRVIDIPLLKANKVQTFDVILSADQDLNVLVIRLLMEYDILLCFDSMRSRDDFYNGFKEFCSEVGMLVSSPQPMQEKDIKSSMRTKAVRDQQLERFFKNIFNHAFKIDLQSAVDEYSVRLEITKVEFAESLALKPDSMFVENMFAFADKDNNGYLSYQEFLNIIVVFAKGSAETKAKLMFDMYDLQGDGRLSQEQFKVMLTSFVELANESIEEDKINDMIETILHDIGLDRQAAITFKDFQKILKDYEQEMSIASLGLAGAGVDMPRPQVRAAAPTRARKTIYKAYRSDTDQSRTDSSRRHSTIEDIHTIEQAFPTSPLQQKWLEILRFIQNYRLQIFWATLYTLVCIGIFAERAYYYSVEREHGGLRQIAGYGVTVTRGAASGMMFTFSCLLVTMCRNLITVLRETFFHRYIPFDSAISFHKYIAYLALGFTVMHIIGHCFNFYHISTQPANDLNCLFRNFFHATDELPKFHDWMWLTITGFTGVLLTVLIFVIYVFAIQYARRNAFKAFWFTHNMHVILWILMILHGAGGLVQPPFFHYFFLGPVILFTLDKLVSISRKKVEIAVLSAELLPSDVTYLRIKKPSNFEYKSGQWVRIAVLDLGTSEYHPFTLSSAPHEEDISLHIRAVGPWTMNLRRTYDPRNLKNTHCLPKIYLDGPYGEGHQDWYRYEVAILVGGGIGVTPFASILKDLAHRSKNKEKLVCKKVYFLWTTRTQKQFEWMTDIIREVEENDLQDLVSCHIFITQFKEKFDVRTTMLYICERYFQKISSRSLFTGLRSVTHFGRPDFANFFNIIQAEHHDVTVFGVFSCGPPPMTAGVEKACSEVNKTITDTLFDHHYENF